MDILRVCNDPLEKYLYWVAKRSFFMTFQFRVGFRFTTPPAADLGMAFQRERVGVVDQGQLMQLDGGYCCDSCGKVTSILRCWKKQLIIAKDARRADVLCFRIALSCRLLNGTSRFRELHELMRDAKARLEADVGPLDEISAKTGRGIASRLPSASEVQKLISLAIEKADELLVAASNSNPNFSEGSLPAACRFHFVEVTSSSVVIVLTDSPAASSDDIKGYKLWYCKCRDETHPKEPISSFSRSQRRILISNLQPCTEYSFRIVSYSDTGNIGHSEVKCFTRIVEVMHRNSISGSVTDTNKDSLSQERLDSKGALRLPHLLDHLLDSRSEILGWYSSWLGLMITKLADPKAS